MARLGIWNGFIAVLLFLACFINMLYAATCLGVTLYLSIHSGSLWSSIAGLTAYTDWFLILAAGLFVSNVVGMNGTVHKSSLTTRIFSFLAVITLAYEVALGVFIAIESRYIDKQTRWAQLPLQTQATLEQSLKCCGYKGPDDRPPLMNPCAKGTLSTACEGILVIAVERAVQTVYGSILLSAFLQFMSFLLSCYLASKFASKQRRAKEELEMERLSSSLKKNQQEAAYYAAMNIPMRPIQTPNNKENELVGEGVKLIEFDSEANKKIAPLSSKGKFIPSWYRARAASNNEETPSLALVTNKSLRPPK